MKKRGVILGSPRCVAWSSVLAGVVFVLLLCAAIYGLGMMALTGLGQMVSSSINPGNYFVWYWIGWGVGVVVWWWLSGSQRRFFRRYKKLNGRVCLVCRGEFDEGAVDRGASCGKCGWVWSLDGLGKKWKKAAGGER